MEKRVQEASSSNSSSSNSTQNWKFDVFLSFRGEDTRRGFTDHLYAALCRNGFKVFRDDEELERGEIISEELLKAIEGSRFAIVVLSENYASSSWCLVELQKILALRNEQAQQVIPIFYHIDPSDVRNQRGKFGKAFAKLEERFQDKEDVKKWRNSLTEVANLSGWDSKDWHEAELIERVIEELWTNLCRRLPSYNDTIIGIDWRVHEMESHLGIGLGNVRFVGIWGLGGIGKTTLARVVYERFHNQFDYFCFLANVREASERDGLVQLQSKLLSHLKIRNMEIKDTYEGKNKILSFCCNKKVLLVLDDVSCISQLQNLAGESKWFGIGSRVIITTRNKKLLISHKVHEIYEVKLMNRDESLQLFCQKAFGRDQPKEDFLELSESMVECAGGLPLALHVMGSFLCGRTMLEWEDALEKFKKVPDKDILKILRISYDGLDRGEKTIFLDIAFFFNGWSKYKVTQILKNCDLNPIIEISTLIEKSLLNDGIYLRMHDLLQQMGRDIVFEESPEDARKRSRLWSKEDIDKILTENIGTEAIQGMILHLKEPYEARWDPCAFSSLCNLRVFIISDNFHLPYSLECLPSALKVLQWSNYPLETPPPATQLDKLVDLKMHDSKIKQLWNKGQCMKNLMLLDLSHSKYLSQTPPSSTLPNLETLELEGCVDLAEFHASLAQNNKLRVLNLKGCKNLKALPEKLEMTSLKEFVLEETNIDSLPSLEFLTSIEVLNLRGCKNLKFLPKLEMNSLKKIVLEATSIEEVPASLEFLSNVEVLNLRSCKNLKVLPRKLEMNSLKEFVLCGCIQVRNLPEFGENMKNLAILDVQKTGLVKLPESLGLLTGLEVLNLRACKNLQVLPRKLEMNSLKEFVLCGCTQVRNLPEFGEIMKNLVTLDVEETSIVKLPESLGLLTSLEVLNLKGCKNLVCLPHIIHNLKCLKIINISGCSKFSNLPENLNENEALEKLDASETAITEVPSSIGQLKKLKTLSFHSFPKGLMFPTSIFNLKSLVELNLSYCNIDDRFIPDDIDGLLSSLQKLDLSGNKLVNRSIFKLKSLTELNLCNCHIEDGFIPDDLSGLSSLWRLNLSGSMYLNRSIFNLKSLIDLDLSYCDIDDGFIPDDLSGLSSLWYLSLDGNNFANLPPGCISNLLNLRIVYLGDCPRLQSLPQPSPHLGLMEVTNCASLETLSSEQLLHFLASIDQGGQYVSHHIQSLKKSLLKTFEATIQGSEIPSWCEIQNYAWLNEKWEASIIIDVPPCEWFGIVLCTMVDSNYEAVHINGDFVNAYTGEFECFRHICDPRSLHIEPFPTSIGIVYDQFRGKDCSDLSRYYTQCRLKFETKPWVVHTLKVDGPISLKCGWRVIREGDFEKWGKSINENHLPILGEHKDGENEMCSEVKEQGQCSLSQFESSQTIINGCETMSPEASSPCLEEEGKLDDSWMQFIYDDARFWF